MRKGLFLLSLIVTFYALGTVSASAVTNDTVKVGLRYGSSVMSSANLENDEGSGYEFGYFEDDRTFVSLGETDETAITMEPAGRDGIQVTITGTDRVLYESREDTLAVMPQGRDPVTWFRGNRYRGGFEYTVSGGGLQVVNVVDLMKLQPHTEHPHGLTDMEYDMLFTQDRPIIFAYHGYPTLIHELTYRRHNKKLHVRGYKEEGTITTPFDMRVLNDIDRFDLVIDTVHRLPQLGNRGAYLVQKMNDKLVEHRQYITTYGQDLPEVRDWKWNDGKGVEV